MVKKTSILKNKKGFTLAETLLAFFILIMIHATSLHLMQAQFQCADALSTYYSPDWDFFVFQMRQDFQLNEGIKTTHQTIEIKKANEIVRYAFYKNADSRMIRRQVNRKGHQPVLMNVQTFQVTDHQNEVMLKLSFINGEEHSLCLPK